jgi:hypothetical protein
MPDSISDATVAGTGIGFVSNKTPVQIRNAQLALTSAAMGDPERESQIREVLSAVGIFNRRGVIDLRASRDRNGVVRDYEREPNGRMSRRGGRRSDRRGEEE